MQANTDNFPQHFPGNYWQWRGEKIYYLHSGSENKDRPPLLLVHGFGASTDHWRKNIAELKKDFSVWAIDLLGFGRSNKPKLPYNGELWQEQLHDFITEVIGQPVILGGNSLGGYSALCLAANYPSAAVGLILLNSAGPFTNMKEDTQPRPLRKFLSQISRRIFLQPWATFLLFKYVQRPATIRKTLEKVYLDKTAITEQLIREIHRPSLDKGAPAVFASVFKTPQGEKVDTLLQKLQCPLLMIWGEADPWMNTRQRGAQFREYYPQLQEHYLQAGHCPHDEVPKQVNDLIRSWVLSKEFIKETVTKKSNY